MTILAGADYLVSVRKGALPSDWKEQFFQVYVSTGNSSYQTDEKKRENG